MDPIFTQQFNMPPPSTGSGMFAGGGDKFGPAQAIALALAGFVSRRNPALLQSIMEMQQKRMDHQQSIADYNRKRSDDNSDWMTQYNYKLQHPEKTDPHYFQDNSGNEMAIGADGQPVVVYKDPNPWKLVPNGMGGVIPVNMDALMHGAANPGMPAPGSVVDDPRKQGGPASQAPGGFPGYF